jgi:hypothetical protein
MAQTDAVLLFSGGRDSTLACLRMVKTGRRPTLLTVTSSHLVGLPAVRRRLTEMRHLLPTGTTWVNVRQPNLADAFPGALATCLPCHLAYVAAGVKLARQLAVSSLAFGYASYQGTWAEQTPYALDLLAGALETAGVSLALPVRDLTSKASAVAELRAAGLTSDALEQKCLQQQHNLPLAPEALRAETTAWAAALADTLSNLDNLSTSVLAEEIFE